MKDYSIKFLLDREDARFTNRDTITGKVEITLHKEISVENIQIKLKGLQEVVISQVPADQSTRSECHEILYDCDTVFPPDNIREISENKNGFTMIPGVYLYDFSFKFPLNSYCGDPNSVREYSKIYNSTNEDMKSQSNQRKAKYGKIREADDIKVSHNHLKSRLPPSCHGNQGLDFFSIKYFLKTTIRRSSGFRTNIKEEFPITFIMSEPNLLTKNEESKSDLIIFKKKQESIEKKSLFKKLLNDDSQKISFITAFNKSSRIIRPDLELPTISISLFTKALPSFFQNSKGDPNGLGSIYIHEITLYLVHITRFSALDMRNRITRHFKILEYKPRDDLKLDLANCVKSDNGLYELKFPNEILQLDFDREKLEKDFVPSFDTCRIQNWYNYEISIKLGNKASSWRHEKVKFTAQIDVLSDIKTPTDLLNESIETVVPKYDEVTNDTKLDDKSLPNYTP